MKLVKRLRSRLVDDVFRLRQLWQRSPAWFFTATCLSGFAVCIVSLAQQKAPQPSPAQDEPPPPSIPVYQGRVYKGPIVLGEDADKEVLLVKASHDTLKRELPDNFALTYVTLEADPKMGIAFPLRHEEVRQGIAARSTLDISSTLAAVLGENSSWAFDPLFIPGKQRVIFKYGTGISSLDDYRLMSYQLGKTQAHPLIKNQIGSKANPPENPTENPPLRNKNVALSPGGKYLAYILGGSHTGSDPAYFPDSLELWVCEIDTGKSRLVARGDDLYESYAWKNDTTLVFSNAVEQPLNKQASKRQKIQRKAAAPKVFDFAYDAAQNTTTRLDEVLNTRQWQNEPFTRDLHRELLRGGIQLGRDLGNPQKNDSFDLTKYYRGSARLDFQSQAVFFFVNDTPRSVIDTANATHNGQLKLSVTLWKYHLLSQQFSRVGAFRVDTYNYEPSFAYLNGAANDHYIFMRSFSSKRSPISPPPNTAYPQSVFSLVKLDGEKSQTLWHVESGAGVSVAVGPSPPILLNY